MDRLIPTDELGPGEGCPRYHYHWQLTAPHGGHDWLYMQGPFSSHTLPTQGLQSPLVPREQYRLGLATLEACCKANFNGRNIVQPNGEEKDKLLGGTRGATSSSTTFRARCCSPPSMANTMGGFFADPIYGGIRDMAGSKLIGCPGARYDFHDVMAKPNQAYTLPPAAMQGGPAWDKTDDAPSSPQGCRLRRSRLGRIDHGARTRPHRP
jgi:gluconate 2-dehydrogenase gamma chain